MFRGEQYAHAEAGTNHFVPRLFPAFHQTLHVKVQWAGRPLHKRHQPQIREQPRPQLPRALLLHGNVDSTSSPLLAGLFLPAHVPYSRPANNKPIAYK